MNNEEKETPKDRAVFLLDLFLLLFAFVMYPAIILLIVLTVAAFLDQEYLLAVAFLAGAGICVFLNRAIIARDDKKEEEKASKKEEEKRARNAELVADSEKFGRLQFMYDEEEGSMILPRKQLPQYGNTWGFQVRNFDSNGTLGCEVKFIERFYQDKEMILENMCKTFYEYCQKEKITQVGSETVDEEYIRKHLQITELTMGMEKEGYYGASLCATCEECVSYQGVHAFLMENSDQYEYYMMSY